MLNFSFRLRKTAHIEPISECKITAARPPCQNIVTKSGKMGRKRIFRDENIIFGTKRNFL